MTGPALRDRVEAALRARRGLLFARPAIVGRNSYTGRGILARNTTFDDADVDARGYAPVEWWILSMVEADNPVRLAGEGVTAINLDDGGAAVPLTEIRAAAESAVFGGAASRWPLVKLLDIGGRPVTPDFSGRPEVPPIPPHLHAGEVVNGHVVPPGKVEAYFFPPTDVPPYNLAITGVVTRIGFRMGTTRDMFLDALRDFGASDAMYALLNEFPVAAWSGWTVFSGAVHAPGPWPTLEVQTPQDDYNFAGWVLGARFPEAERPAKFAALALRGLASAEAFLDELVDWKLSATPDPLGKFYRPAEPIDAGTWGRRLRIFFDIFDGEAIELLPGANLALSARSDPSAMIVWSGAATVNGNVVSAADRARREMLVTPGTALDIAARGGNPLILLAVHPMRAAPEAAS